MNFTRTCKGLLRGRHCVTRRGCHQKAQQDAAAVPCECVVIDEALLLDAVRDVNEAGRPAHAESVRGALGKIAVDGGYFDVMAVAADLAELESLGKLKRAPAFDWDDSGPTPKTRIPYVLHSEQ